MTRHAGQRTALVAPDSFKGTFSANRVADAIAEGSAYAGWNADRCPVADGGEGTMDVLLTRFGGETLHAAATGPIGQRVNARFALLSDRQTAVVETAEASGLHLSPATGRDAESATSFGTGELILAARAAGATKILLGAGGSATTDGGAGAIDAINLGGGLRETALVILCDVSTPFESAAIVFGPQKGASPDAVERLQGRLDRLAQRLPVDPRGVPMTGCAGGLSGGLWAQFGAQLVAGAAAVLDVLDFDKRLSRADAVITGEGQLDDQSAAGKITGEIARRANAASVPVHAIVGRNRLTRSAGNYSLASVAEATTLDAIENAAARLLQQPHG